MLFQNRGKFRKKTNRRKEKNLHSRTNSNVHQQNFCGKFVGWHAEMGQARADSGEEKIRDSTNFISVLNRY